MIEQRAGANPSDKIYWRRNKIERDVAVAFLIDMSASTDEEINKREKKYDDDDYDDDPRKYLSWWVSKRRQELTEPAEAHHRPRKRVDGALDDGAGHDRRPVRHLRLQRLRARQR